MIIEAFHTNSDLKIDVRDTKSEEFLHTELAPSFGKLNKEGLQEMDDQLKIMIAGTMKILAKQTDKSWNAVLSTMMQNELLEPDGSEVVRADKIIKESTSDFKTDGSPDANIVREVWLLGKPFSCPSVILFISPMPNNL